MQSLQISVCAHGGADFNNISEAIKNAGQGDVIILKAGQYDERIVLDKPVSIKSENAEDRKAVIIAGGLVVTSEGTGVSGLTIQQGVDVRSGSLKLEGCDVEHGDGVKIGQNSQAQILKCTVTGANQLGDGIYFMEGSKGVIAECNINNHRVNGIHIKAAQVDILQNTIKSCRYGIYFRKGAKGNCEGNIISDMSNHGIYAALGSEPTVVKNEISACAIQGIIVTSGTAGTYRENKVNGNVHILTGSTAACEGNTITGFYDNEPIGLSTSGGSA
jgi:parallel beta-helix repeat protein